MNDQRAEVMKCVSLDCPLFPYRMNGIDKAIEIVSLLNDAHIGAVSETKN